LSEDHLLAGFGGDGLVEELRALAGVEVRLETPDARLAKAGQLLGEVEGFVDGGEGVIVCAWSSKLGRAREGGAENWALTLWGSTAWSTEQIGEQGCVSRLLISHELDEKSVTWSQACSRELLLRECSEDIMEEIQLDPLLVQA
jgi:hypothetical protein